MNNKQNMKMFGFWLLCFEWIWFSSGWYSSPDCILMGGLVNRDTNFVSRFIYTDEVDSDDIDMTVEVLAASDKYDVKVLFNKCQLHLSHNIDVDNAADCFLAAYLHEKAVLLKETSFKFIKENYKEVKKSPGFSGICLQLLDESINRLSLV